MVASSGTWTEGAAHVSRGRAIAASAGGTTFSKVPEVTFGFWIIKIAATTLGETAGDAVTMSLDLGYLVGTALFATLFAILVAVQIRARRFRPFLFWAVIVATTTVGTTLADFVDRSLGIGYVGGSLLLLTCLLVSLGAWYGTFGAVSVGTVASPKVEIFYWVTILFSQTLGTAVGDFFADGGGFGYGGSALIFGAVLSIVLLLRAVTNHSRDLLFWAAFVVSRPLGAALGDALDKPLAQGGFALSRASASLILAAFIVACIRIMPQRAEQMPGPGKDERG